MKKYKYHFFSLLLILLLINCNSNDDNNRVFQNTICDQFSVIDNALYQSSQSDFFSVESFTLIGDCLSVTISASGCSGDSWQYQLIDSGITTDTLPTERSLRLILTNNESCLAVFTRTVTFDLTPLQIAGEDQVVLFIENFPDSIQYIY